MCFIAVNHRLALQEGIYLNHYQSCFHFINIIFYFFSLFLPSQCLSGLSGWWGWDMPEYTHICGCIAVLVFSISIVLKPVPHLEPTLPDRRLKFSVVQDRTFSRFHYFIRLHLPVQFFSPIHHFISFFYLNSSDPENLCNKKYKLVFENKITVKNKKIK